MLLHPDLDAEVAESLREASPAALWSSSGELVGGGRGGVRRIRWLGRDYLLKREIRGGMAGLFLPDIYFRRGPFQREWDISLALSLEGVTPPILARWFIRRGIFFSVFSLVQPLPSATSLTDLWRGGELSGEFLEAAGLCIGALHRRGVFHGDLSAGNLLALPGTRVVAIDWRHSRIAPELPEEARRDNLLRLARSLHKTRLRYRLEWPPSLWDLLCAGYGRGFGASEPWLRQFSASAAGRFALRKLVWRRIRKVPPAGGGREST